MEDLPTRRAPTKPLKNALLTASQDSGIGDSTILASPTSVASVPAIIWTPDRVDPMAAMKSTIDGKNRYPRNMYWFHESLRIIIVRLLLL